MTVTEQMMLKLILGVAEKLLVITLAAVRLAQGKDAKPQATSRGE